MPTSSLSHSARAGSSDVHAERKSYPLVSSDYTLFEEVGQGASATVYRAQCVPLNEEVAIKILDLEKCNSNLEEICREAQMMSLINHANVVKAHCSFVVKQSLWVVMPFMAGGSCLHIMKASFPDGFEEPVIATVLKDALKALEYLHFHGHIHRDVKAGNILVAANGAIKLGDFGVSACMFDAGDRQRSRNTFVGTPCWMAPEVMEQLHGYDFKADIWSFGITALELAHGHAPFSKYPPMKVLLMTLQNAPPGLDYERDKRFSKSFKEMIAMCLVKDPTKRPSAEKLSKHSFFKHARNFDYIYRHILEGVPPLGERVQSLKMKDAARLAQKKMPYGEQEERSQNEYKRGVSIWNFSVDDLKTQAAMIPDDDESSGGKEEYAVGSKLTSQKESDEGLDALGCQSARSSCPSIADLDRHQGSTGSNPSKADPVIDAADRLLLEGLLLCTTQSKHKKGHQEGLHDEDAGPGAADRHVISRGSEEACGSGRDLGRDEGLSRTGSQHDIAAEKHPKRVESGDVDCDRHEARRLQGGAVVLPERGMLKGLENDGDKGREGDHGHVIRTSEDSPKAQPRERVARDGDYSSVRGGEDSPRAQKRMGNGPLGFTGHKDVVDEKPKGGIVQKKGRFSVTSEDDGSVEGVSHSTSTSQSIPPTGSAPTIPAAAVFSHLQNALHHCSAQHEIILNLMRTINPAELSASQRQSYANSKAFHRIPSVGSTDLMDPPAELSASQRQSYTNLKSFHRTPSVGSTDLMDSSSSHRESEHQQQIAELQSRVASLVLELQAEKSKSMQLERQLNAIYSEEDKIWREEADKRGF